MANCYVNIKKCKISKPYLNNERSFARADITWLEGSIDFKKKCVSFIPPVIAFIEANPDAEFEILGSLTKKEGTKDWVGKWFEQIIITEIKIAD